MDEAKLKSCPFCGHAPSWRLTKKKTCQLHGDEYQDYILGCFSPRCPIKPYKLSNLKSDCIKSWNKRN